MDQNLNNPRQYHSLLLPNGCSVFSKKLSPPPLPRRWLVLFRRNSITAIILVSLVLVYLIPWRSCTRTLTLEIDRLGKGSNKVTVRDSQGVGRNLTSSKECRIPDVPLWSHAFMAASSTNKYDTKISQCGDGSKFTKFKDTSTLELLHPEQFDRNNCTVFEVERPILLSNDSFVLREVGSFGDGNQIGSLGSAEHLIVTCNSSGEIVIDYHSRVLHTSGYLPSKINHWKTKSKEEIPVNVMVLVLDSTSATDAFRQIPKTINYLLEDLNFVYFSRYHALGEPTFLNAMPLLTGMPTHTFFQTKKWLDQWDETEFIWKHFNKSQFATAYMEDIPRVGTFNYGNQTGFLHKPTDFYPRSFFSAWESLGGQAAETCVGTASTWKYLYDYQLEILRTLNGILPSFTMPWLCWPFHDYFNTLSAIESDTLEFFQKIAKSKEILENTVMMVMGDHGFYQGPYAESDEGLIERRLPLFLIRIPQRLTHFIPNVEAIIHRNSKQVVSHYDVFKTLFHLSQISNKDLDMTKTDETGLGRTLFKLLPRNRNCEGAGIPRQWCACNLPEANSSNQTLLGFQRELQELKIHRAKPFVDRRRT